MFFMMGIQRMPRITMTTVATRPTMHQVFAVNCIRLELLVEVDGEQHG